MIDTDYPDDLRPPPNITAQAEFQPSSLEQVAGNICEYK